MSDQPQEQQFPPPPPGKEQIQAPPQHEPQEPQKKTIYKQVWFWVVIAVVLVSGIIGVTMPKGESVDSENTDSESDRWADAESNGVTYSVMEKWGVSKEGDTICYFFSPNSANSANFIMITQSPGNSMNSKAMLASFCDNLGASFEEVYSTSNKFDSINRIDGYSYRIRGTIPDVTTTVDWKGFVFVSNDGTVHNFSVLLDPSNILHKLYKGYADDFFKSITPSNGNGIPYVELPETDEKQDAPTPESEPEPTPEPPEPSVSVSQKNALREARSYLDYTAFSYTGLIEQLEYEGYSNEDATYGADNCGADWYEQAEKMAASYLEYKGFSRNGLIEQLEYEGFTPEQAIHGADSVGL
jgi:hypothetical protein